MTELLRKETRNWRTKRLRNMRKEIRKKRKEKESIPNDEIMNSKRQLNRINIGQDKDKGLIKKITIS